MSNKTFKLGPIQEKWISSLEKYPEKHKDGTLGIVLKDGTIKCCCLGQGLQILNEEKLLCKISEDFRKEYNFDFFKIERDHLMAGTNSSDLSEKETFKLLGLRNGEGIAVKSYLPSFLKNDELLDFESLIDLNDTFCYEDFIDCVENDHEIYGVGIHKKLVEFVYSAYENLKMEPEKRTPWILIAKIIRSYPRAFFNKSV